MPLQLFLTVIIPETFLIRFSKIFVQPKVVLSIKGEKNRSSQSSPIDCTAQGCLQWSNIFHGIITVRKNKKAGSNNYLCTFRVGEIYLTAAEAAARLGELSQARTRLLELMRKRYAPEAYEAKSVVVNAMDKEALVQEILDERARELAFEGHRWFDLRRSTRPRLEKVLDGTRYVLEENDSRYTLPFRKKP